MKNLNYRRAFSFFVTLAICLSLFPATAFASTSAGNSAAQKDDKVVFFVADGMRQDLAEQYASRRN